MIEYNDGCFNLSTIFRVHGSASYKAVGFATWSSGIYLLLYNFGGDADGSLGYDAKGLKHYELLDHPYPVSVIVTAFMFVLASKVNFSYNRFWEACTALHNMHAKWLDVGCIMAAFHMQSKAFDQIRPPSFGDHPHLTDNAPPQRDQKIDIDLEITEIPTASSEESDQSQPMPDEKSNFDARETERTERSGAPSSDEMASAVEIHAPSPSQCPRGLPFPDYKSRSRGEAVHGWKSRRCASLTVCQSKTAAPTLFLQEAAHLVSLLSAVALSSLRCDSQDARASMTEFVPCRDWPDYNSENDDMQKYGYRRNALVKTLKYVFDVSRTRDERSAYNAARPFAVIGGVSNREALLLQRARGASAKTALAFVWLNEFIIREQLHGSLGAVAPPIVSRLPQYMSDGHMWYNSARKMSYIPFPFPHAQMATLFVILSTVLMPTLMLSKTSLWFGLCLNFTTVLLFAGLNELSKELEYPFRGMPNDLPLNLFQAHFNEALVTMFGGFHPDSWWEIKGDA